MAPCYSVRYSQAPDGDSDDPSLTSLYFKRRDTVRPHDPFTDNYRHLVSIGAMNFDNDTGVYFSYEGPTYRTYVPQQVSGQELYETISRVLLSMDICERRVVDFIVDKAAKFWLTVSQGHIVPLFVYVDVDREMLEDEAPEEEEEEEVESLLEEVGMGQNCHSDEETLPEEVGMGQNYDSDRESLLQEGMGQNFITLLGECYMLGNIPQGSQALVQFAIEKYGPKL